MDTDEVRGRLMRSVGKTDEVRGRLMRSGVRMMRSGGDWGGQGETDEVREETYEVRGRLMRSGRRLRRSGGD